MSINKFKLSIRLVLLLLLGTAGTSYLLLTFGAHHYCEGFSKQAISGKLKYEARWATSSPPMAEIQAVLGQPYYYLAKGSQSYIFESADGEWVIKFFRLNRFRAKALPETLPLFLREASEQKVKRKQAELEELLTSCHIAYTKLREECALFYLHLNPTDTLGTEVLLHDKLGRMSLINADKTPFLIQRKSELLYDHLYKLAKAGEHTQLEYALMSLSHLLLTRFERGIADHDPVIEKNAGFSNGRAVFIDIGQFYYSSDIVNEEVYCIEAEGITRYLKKWLDTNAPQKGEELANSLKF